MKELLYGTLFGVVIAVTMFGAMLLHLYIF